jgi:hypothetical protein
LNSDIASKARQSDVNPGKMINISKILPRTLQTFNPNIFFLPQKQLPELHPESRRSLGGGLFVHISMPSTAPAQQANPADDTSDKAAAIVERWLS